MKLLSRALLLTLALNLSLSTSRAAEDVIPAQEEAVEAKVEVSTQPIMALDQTEATTSLIDAEANLPESVKTVEAKDRLKKLIRVARVAVSELIGQEANPTFMQKFEAKLASLIDSAAKHNFPLPTGISVGIDTDAGFVIGGSVGTEFVFILQEDGTIGFGAFPFVLGEVGAGAMFARGAFCDLMFNIHKVSDFEGAAIGVSGDVGFIKNMDAEFTIGIDPKDFENARGIFSNLMGKKNNDKTSIVDKLINIAKQDRPYFAGFGISAGVGGKVTGFAGWWFKVYETSISFDEFSVRNEIRTAKAKVQHLNTGAFRLAYQKSKESIIRKHELRKQAREEKRRQRLNKAMDKAS